MATDPYYFSRDLFNIQSQRRALGSSREFTPEALSSVVGANFKAQQENEITQTNIRQNQERIGQANEAANRAQHENARASETAGIMGAAQLAISAPLAIYAGKALIGGGAAATTGAGVGSGAGAEAGMALSTEMGVGGGYVQQSAITGAGAEVGGTGALSTGTVAAAGAGGALALGASVAGTNWAARELKLPGKADWYGAGAGIGGAMVSATLIPLAVGKDIWDWASNNIGTPHAEINLGPVHASSIICTELNRQGLLKDSMLRASSAYIKKHQEEDGNREFYLGYLIFASPIVEKMNKSKLFTYLIMPYGSIICRECASRESKKYKSTFMSRLVYSVSGFIFKQIYANTVAKWEKTLCH
jgi:hypothetical protein